MSATDILKQLKFAAIFMAFFSSVATDAQEQNDPVPVDPKVTIGRLDNGLTYYIRKNDTPARAIELRLVVKAGSSQEDEDQIGAAHLIEHLAFRETETFKKDELVSYFQSIGVKYGVGLNAVTTDSETVYTLPLPANSPEVIKSGFHVLRGWAGGIKFSNEILDAERGVVLEEKRLRQNYATRYIERIRPIVYKGTLLADRMPIGTDESIKSVKLEALQRFYKDWYRPNLMAIIVVGDIEVEATKELIRTNFYDLVNPSNERPHRYSTAPNAVPSSSVTFVDKDVKDTRLEISTQLRNAPPIKTVGDYRLRQYVSKISSHLINERIKEISQKINAPVLSGGGGEFYPMRDVVGFTTFVTFKPELLEDAINAMVTERTRMHQYGFSEMEIARAKKLVLQVADSKYGRKAPSNFFANEYLANFVSGLPVPGVGFEFEYGERVMSEIKSDEVNNYVKTLLDPNKKTFILYSGSESPKHQNLQDLVDRATRIQAAPPDQEAGRTSLLKKIPDGGKIVSRKSIQEAGADDWVLSNGVRVIFKRVPEEKISLNGRRHGGVAMFDYADRFNATNLSNAIRAMGLADLSPLEASRLLVGKNVMVSKSLGMNSDNISGISSPDNFETMMQLVYMQFLPPRRDDALFKSFVQKSVEDRRKALSNPDVIFRDFSTRKKYGDNKWAQSATPNDFANLDLDRILEINKSRFSSAEGMTFVLTGNAKTSEVERLVARYLGDLPASVVESKIVDLKITPAEGVIEEFLPIGSDQKGIVSISFGTTGAYDAFDLFKLEIVKEILNQRVVRVLREKGLVYAPSIRSTSIRDNGFHSFIEVLIPCSPENTSVITKEFFAIVDDFLSHGPTETELEGIKNHQNETLKNASKTADYWNSLLINAFHYSDNLFDTFDRENFPSRIQTADIHAAAKKYLRKDSHIKIIKKPV